MGKLQMSGGMQADATDIPLYPDVIHATGWLIAVYVDAIAHSKWDYG